MSPTTTHRLACRLGYLPPVTTRGGTFGYSPSESVSNTNVSPLCSSSADGQRASRPSRAYMPPQPFLLGGGDERNETHRKPAHAPCVCDAQGLLVSNQQIKSATNNTFIFFTAQLSTLTTTNSFSVGGVNLVKNSAFLEAPTPRWMLLLAALLALLFSAPALR